MLKSSEYQKQQHNKISVHCGFFPLRFKTPIPFSFCKINKCLRFLFALWEPLEVLRSVCTCGLVLCIPLVSQAWVKLRGAGSKVSAGFGGRVWSCVAIGLYWWQIIYLCIYLLRHRRVKNWKKALQPLNPFMSLYVPAVKLLLCLCHPGLVIFTASRSMLRTYRLLKDQLYLFQMHFNILSAWPEFGKSLW